MQEQEEQKEQKEEQKKDRKLLWLILLLFIVIAVLGAAVYLLARGGSGKALDYAPQKIDTAAVQMEDSGEKLSAPEGGGAVSLTYSTDVLLNLQEKKAQILFENPSKSTQDMVLQLLVTGKDGEEEVLAQSDLIPAGYRLEELLLPGDLTLSSGSYEGLFRVLYYDAKSGEKAVLNTEIPVKLTVNHGV